MSTLVRPDQHNDDRAESADFNAWLKKQKEKRHQIVVSPKYEKRRHSYSIYEYEYIKLSRQLRFINKNKMNGDDPLKTADNYDKKATQWAIAGFIFENYRRFTPYEECYIPKKLLAINRRI